MWYTYILKSDKDGSLYKGQTDNLTRRLKQHNKGRCKATKNKVPLQLIHYIECETREEARSYEIFYKTGKGREILNEIIGRIR